MTSHVKTWTESHPRLARTAQRFPRAATALSSVCGSDQTHLQIAKILLDHGAESYHLPEAIDISPLCIAAEYGQEAITELLIEKRPDLVNPPENRGSPPLFWAVVKNPPNAVSIVQLLLNHGANANEISDRLLDYRPIHLAAHHRNLGMVGLLLDNGAFINAQDARGSTPLAVAMINDNIELCRLLLARGADTILIDVDGNSLLALAVLEGVSPLVVKLLLEQNVDRNAKNRHGESALHLAARMGRVDFVKVLIDFGIDINATSALGGTALHVASNRAGEEIAKELIASAADVNVIDVQGRKALHVAIFGGHLEVFKLLVEKTSNINQQDVYGNTALSIAALNGEEAAVNLLLNAGTQIVSQEPGPQCPFLDPEEMVSGYCRDALLVVMSSLNLGVIRTIVEFVGGRNQESGYAEVLDMLDAKDMEALCRWCVNRATHAPLVQSKFFTMNQGFVSRAEVLVEENRRRIAAELGIPYLENGQCFENANDWQD